jgi:hypothetical protein
MSRDAASAGIDNPTCTTLCLVEKATIVSTSITMTETGGRIVGRHYMQRVSKDERHWEMLLGACPRESEEMARNVGHP